MTVYCFDCLVFCLFFCFYVPLKNIKKKKTTKENAIQLELYMYYKLGMVLHEALFYAVKQQNSVLASCQVY
jgi:hypothetical protein